MLRMPLHLLKDYETGIRSPTVTDFRNMARKYRLSEAVLARKNPPTIPPLPKDNRTFIGRPPRLSFETLVAIDEVRAQQNYLTEIADEMPDFIRHKLPRYDMGQSPGELGERERSRLGISSAYQLRWRDARTAFTNWREIIEPVGVYVYLEKFPLNDCRAFSLTDPHTPPAIVINKSESLDQAKIFSLVHEYAHLLIRKPGLSDQNYKSNLESYCNKFAGGFLMPEHLLKRLIPISRDEPRDWEPELIRSVAANLKVSQQALVLRLEQLRRAPAGFFDRFKETQKRWEKPPMSQGFGGDYVKNQVYKLGHQYTRTVLRALNMGILSRFEVARILGFSPDHFAELGRRLGTTQ